jgi:hypothetical protein
VPQRATVPHKAPGRGSPSPSVVGGGFSAHVDEARKGVHLDGLGPGLSGVPEEGVLGFISV